MLNLTETRLSLLCSSSTSLPTTTSTTDVLMNEQGQNSAELFCKGRIYVCIHRTGVADEMVSYICFFKLYFILYIYMKKKKVNTSLQPPIK